MENDKEKKPPVYISYDEDYSAPPKPDQTVTPETVMPREPDPAAENAPGAQTPPGANQAQSLTDIPQPVSGEPQAQTPEAQAPSAIPQALSPEPQAQNMEPQPLSTEPTPSMYPPVSEPPRDDLVIKFDDPPQKNGKKRLIIISAIAAAILVVIGAGFGVFAAVKTNPANVAAGAISNLITSKNVQLSGSIAYEYYDEVCDDDDNCEPAEEPETSVSFNLNSQNANMSTSSTLNAGATVNGIDVNLALSEVSILDGNLYFKVSGLKDSLDGFLNQFDASPTTQCYPVYSSDTGEEDGTYCYDIPVRSDLAVLASLSDVLNNLAETVDDQWWKLNPAEFLRAIGNAEDANKYQGYYDCAESTLKNISANSGEIAGYYRDHPFVKLKDYTGGQYNTSGGTLYQLSLDADEFFKFIKAFVSSPVIDKTVSCIASVDSAMGESFSGFVEQIRTTDQEPDGIATVQEDFDDLPPIVIEADSWSHILKAIHLHYTSNSIGYYNYNLDLQFTYPDNLQITAPADSKPAAEFAELVQNVIDAYRDRLFNYNGDDIIEYTVEEVEEVIEEPENSEEAPEEAPPEEAPPAEAPPEENAEAPPAENPDEETGTIQDTDEGAGTGTIEENDKI